MTGSQKSVFDTATARELRLVLHAVLHPEDPAPCVPPCCHAPVRRKPRRVQALRHDAAAWDSHASRFHGRVTLERGGPLALVAALLEQHAARLLDTVEGERIPPTCAPPASCCRKPGIKAAAANKCWRGSPTRRRGGDEGGDAADARAAAGIGCRRVQR